MQQPAFKYTDRQADSAAAKQAMLAKFKPKPMIKAEAPIDREAERLARVAELRAQRAAERAAKEEARIAAIKAEEAAQQEALEMTDSQRRAERKDRKAQVKAEARAKREAKSAMRRG